MTVLKVGQKLWWADKEKHTEGFVIVADITESEILVWYEGKLRARPHSVIGKNLFLTPQLNKLERKQKRCSNTQGATQKIAIKRKYISKYSSSHISSKQKVDTVLLEPQVKKHFFETTDSSEKSCEKCALRKNGTCSSLANRLCEDYRVLQSISAEERNSYPQYGDVSAFRQRDRKHFK